jgi:hypothetical protein
MTKKLAKQIKGASTHASLKLIFHNTLQSHAYILALFRSFVVWHGNCIVWSRSGEHVLGPRKEKTILFIAGLPLQRLLDTTRHGATPAEWSRLRLRRPLALLYQDL